MFGYNIRIGKNVLPSLGWMDLSVLKMRFGWRLNYNNHFLQDEEFFSS